MKTWGEGGTPKKVTGVIVIGVKIHGLTSLNGTP